MSEKKTGKTTGRINEVNPQSALPGDMETARRRRLKKGERISLEKYGLPFITLAGHDQEIYELENGEKVPVIHNLAPLFRVAFMHVIMIDHHPLRKEELRFIRKHMNMTQDQLANILGVSRETISRFETGCEEISAIVSNSIRYYGIQHLLSGVEALHKPQKAIQVWQKLSDFEEVISNLEKIKKDNPAFSSLNLAFG